MVQEYSLPESSPPPQREVKSVNVIRILAVVAILLIVGLAVSVGTWVNTYKALTASVQYEGDRFIIQNGDNFQWTDVRLLLNSDFKFNTSDILAQNGFSVLASQFAKDDGTKFDLNTASPTDLYVTTRVSELGWSSFFYKFQ
jgi:hypothetical protein